VGLYDQLFDGYRNYAQQSTAAIPFLPTAGLRAQAAAGAAQALALADKYNANNKPFDFFSIGASYDPGKWFVMSEWGQTDSESVFGKRAAWYATGGYRWGKFTPYVTYAESKLKSNQSDPGITAVPPIPGLQNGAAQLNGILNGQDGLAGAPIQKTISVGLRWDVARNTALKLQYDYSRIGDNSPGTLDHTTDAFRPGGDFEVFSATVDFVF
jgi:predicted porin